tara:strand:+ start:697 stop:1191 length:495 start_codon:yes stop_codon:yes gene_type:complete
MVKSTLFQNLLKATSIDSITPAMILQAGAPIFFDLANNPDLKAVSTVVDAYRGVHAPLYGQPIPLTGLISSADGSETILAPSSNEVRKIIALSCTNAGAGAPIVLDVKLGAMILQSVIADPSATTAVLLDGDVYSSKNLPLSIVVTSGTAAELTTKAASILISQ